MTFDQFTTDIRESVGRAFARDIAENGMYDQSGACYLMASNADGVRWTANFLNLTERSPSDEALERGLTSVIALKKPDFAALVLTAKGGRYDNTPEGRAQMQADEDAQHPDAPLQFVVVQLISKTGEHGHLIATIESDGLAWVPDDGTTGVHSMSEPDGHRFLNAMAAGYDSTMMEPSAPNGEKWQPTA